MYNQLTALGRKVKIRLQNHVLQLDVVLQYCYCSKPTQVLKFHVSFRVYVTVSMFVFVISNRKASICGDQLR